MGLERADHVPVGVVHGEGGVVGQLPVPHHPHAPQDRNEGDRPEYHWVRSNDINWCAGAKSQAYHCSVAIVVGQATEAQPER